MLTPDDMQKQADSIVNIYSYLEDKIFSLIIYTLQNSHFDEVNQTNVLLWQAEQLNKMGALNDKIIELLAQMSKKTVFELKQLIVSNGMKIVNEIDNELQRMTQRSVPVSKEIDGILDSFIRQTFRDLNNNVNQTLVTTNFQESAVMRAYQAILKQSTLEVITGLKTHEQAVRDNVYRMVDNGLKSSFIDRGGHEWSLETYSKTVIQSTSHRTFNDLRLTRMENYECVTALMSSHLAARKACAHIQGKVVNIVPMSDSRADKHYKSIYDYGYGEPDGTQGINCKHILYPFIPGVNTNNQPQYDPKEVMRNAEVQQRQRNLERDIRNQKKRMNAAKDLQDESMIKHCNEMIRSKQKQIRELVDEHEFLVRNYSREQIYSK